MKTVATKAMPPYQTLATFAFLAATGVFGAACSSETSPPLGDTNDDQSTSTLSTSTLSTTTVSTTAQTTALTTSSSTQASSSSSHASTSSSSHSSSSTASSTGSNASSSNESSNDSTRTSSADDSETSSASGASSSQSADSTDASDEPSSTNGSSETSTNGSEESSEDVSSEDDSPLSAGCGKEPTLASNMYNNGNPISITAANRQRRYILSVPTDYDNTKPYNLVIAWHQLDGNDKQMYEQNYYWIKSIPEAASSTIFVAPNGEKNGTPCTGNGSGEGGCGWPDSSGSNVELADAVVAQIEENFCIDKTKIFANGWSYGGSMSYRTACSRPLGGSGTWGVRAVAVYNGAAQLSSGGCNPSKEVAFYASHGTNDTVLGYDGGVSMANTYAELNGCSWMTPTKATGNHVCTKVDGCMTGYPVEFCSFVGPHTPDPQEGGQRWQPQEVWNFFTQL